ncbi:hypothetical protein [Hymenobacter actinosclerus]|uniref:Uncharacterized protein n=1 Tax=Hymenobacter actinosclerus TaxID=82805 RepID=A0A1I0F9Z1_9BACT|nr:hypothetical protein [Hymenobacter actinosclerus]SET54736.1 hypothetical protein SAMN04487998_2176 [Hymenobacter actinosclerus]
MSLDTYTFLQHTADAEKTIVYTRGEDEDGDEILIPCPALLIAQTEHQKLYITIESQRRYLTHTLIPGELEPETDFLRDYEEVEALLEDAGLDGIHDGEQGILYHNLLFLLMNP